MKNRLMGLAVLSLLIGCQRHEKTSDLAKNAANEVLRTLSEDQILVLDGQRNPVPGAEINVAGVAMKTDDQGLISVPAAWSDIQTLRITKPGYVPAAYLEQSPGKNIFIIKEIPKLPFEVKGVTSGYPNLAKDGYVDFSLITQPFSISDIMNFELNRMISDQIDKMEVMGREILLPSNVSVPKQKENYAIFSLTIEKPLFRTFYGLPGEKGIGATRGRFELKPVISKLQNGASFFDVINDMQFQSLEVQPLNVTGNLSQDLNTNRLALDTKVKHTSSQVPNGLMYLAATFYPFEGRFTPSDLKFFKSNESLELLYPGKKVSPYLLRLIGEKKQTKEMMIGMSPRMSIAFTPANEAETSEMLDPVPSPQVLNGKVLLHPPKLKSAVRPLSTQVTITKVSTLFTRRSFLESKEILWEIYGPGWMSEIEIAALVRDGLQNGNRLEVSFLGSTSDSSGPISLQAEEATHATRNAIDF